MSLVIAIEPDARQADILTRVVRQRTGVELVVTDTKDAAVEALHERIPDLILVSALLSPRDESDLSDHLRGLAEAEHLQTLTIPLLAASSRKVEQKPKKKRGLLGKLRGRRSGNGPVVDENAGCDPTLFADEVRGYLSHAEEVRLASAARRDRERREATAAEARERAVQSPMESAAEPAATVEPESSIIVTAPEPTLEPEPSIIVAAPEPIAAPEPAIAVEPPTEAVPVGDTIAASSFSLRDVSAKLAGAVAATVSRIAQVEAEIPIVPEAPEFIAESGLVLEPEPLVQREPEVVVAAAREPAVEPESAGEPEPSMMVAAPEPDVTEPEPIATTSDPPLLPVVEAPAPVVPPRVPELPPPRGASPPWMTDALARLRAEFKQMRKMHFPRPTEMRAAPAPGPVPVPAESDVQMVAPPASPPTGTSHVGRPVEQRVEPPEPSLPPPTDEYDIHDGRKYGFGALMAKLEAAGFPTEPVVAEGPSAADLLQRHAATVTQAEVRDLSEMLDAVPAQVLAPDPFGEIAQILPLPKRSGLTPLAMWARADLVMPVGDIPHPEPEDDLPALMARLEVPPGVAAVRYGTGCRIRRVRVTRREAPPRDGTKSLDPVIILSRKKLRELREVENDP
jgi:CheY-like chemotaxis protein